MCPCVSFKVSLKFVVQGTETLRAQSRAGWRGSSVMRMMFERLVKDTRGQDLIEYALLGSVIALGVLGAMIYVKDKISSEFSSIGNTLTAGS